MTYCQNLCLEVYQGQNKVRTKKSKQQKKVSMEVLHNWTDEIIVDI